MDSDVNYEGEISGSGNSYFIHYQAQNTVLPALYWIREQSKNAEIRVIKSEFVIDQDTLNVGSMMIKGISSSQAGELGKKFGLDLIRSSSAPESDKTHAVQLPRVAIYHTWFNTQDEGWSRYTFEQRGIPYTSIDKDDLKAGNLNSKFDVILVPRSRGTASDFIHALTPDLAQCPIPRPINSLHMASPTPALTSRVDQGFLG
ncbi:hypothetical protein [Algoriphagus boritolerans]|uniref:hypothetical protein n=1 Tax=Algoriphagus boritolerans TaxID=308111 RepID=UPI002FCE500F